jgi:hypothetical protein
MIHFGRSFIYVIIVIFIDISIASADGDIDKKVTDLFEINWESMRYVKSVTQYNPKVSSNQQPSRADEKLTLNCRVEIKDPNLILGISRKGFLTGLTDSRRRNIELDQEEPESVRPSMPAMRNMPVAGSMDMWYEGLRYERRFTQPPKIPRWRLLLYKYLRIQPKPFKPELVNELQPARLQFDLDLGLLETSGGEIRNLKGYYYALVAESIEHVEVPFEPNDQWVHLTDDVAIQVKEAECKISDSGMRYNFDIEEDQSSRRGIPNLAVGDYLPEKMVMGRQLIKADGEPTDPSMGHGFLPVHVYGSGSGSHSGSRGINPIKKIRFVIAVNPKHYKVTFELKNIPLPNPESKEEKE